MIPTSDTLNFGLVLLRLSEKEKKEILEVAAADFDTMVKIQADPDGEENTTSTVSTNFKPEKSLKFKALQAAKRKEAGKLPSQPKSALS